MNNESRPSVKSVGPVHIVEVILLVVMLTLFVASLFMLSFYKANVANVDLSQTPSQTHEPDPGNLEELVSPIETDVEGSISRALIDQYGEDVRFTDPFAADEDCNLWMYTPDMLAVFCSDDVEDGHELLDGAIPFLDLEDFLPPVFTLESPEGQLHQV